MPVNDTRWTCYNPVHIVYEDGAINRLAEFAKGERAALVTTAGFRRRGVVDRVERAMGSRLVAVLDDVEPNPDVAAVDARAARLRPEEPDLLIALGGGSTMDTAKGLARLLSQPADRALSAYFRDGHAFDPVPALPVIAIPTTAGTGSEVTPFGTIWDFQRGEKHSVSGDDLFAAFALIDPELIRDLPEEITISSALDAVSHALESTWNRSANPVSLGLCARSLQLSLPALDRLKVSPSDTEAKRGMMQASLLAGMAISQTRTALAHSISYPLTFEWGLPHGLACSFTLPALLLFNQEADDGRLDELAGTLGFQGVHGLHAHLDTLLRDVRVGELISRYITDPSAIMTTVDQTRRHERANNNMRQASREDIKAIVSGSIAALGLAG